MCLNNLLKLSLFIFSINISFAQSIKKIKVKEVQELYSKTNDTVYVINFWATWCGPCVKEIPDFEKIKSSFEGKKVKIYLFSLDFAKDIAKVEKFKTSKNLQNEVFLVDEPNYNEWLDKIDLKWSGSIPTTLIFKNNVKYDFVEHEINYSYLEKKINELL